LHDSQDFAVEVAPCIAAVEAVMACYMALPVPKVAFAV